MLVELASTPVAAGLFFLYIKDKYEKEPWKMLFLGVLFGAHIASLILYNPSATADIQEKLLATDRKSTRLNSSHEFVARMPSSA